MWLGEEQKARYRNQAGLKTPCPSGLPARLRSESCAQSPGQRKQSGCPETRPCPPPTPTPLTHLGGLHACDLDGAQGLGHGGQGLGGQSGRSSGLLDGLGQGVGSGGACGGGCKWGWERMGEGAGSEPPYWR